jgi:hypothetical protein
LVITLSRDSVPVRPAASCFSSSRPRRRSAALWICTCVLVSGCSSSLGSCADQAFSMVLADRALDTDFFTCVASSSSSGRPAPGAPFMQGLVRARSAISAIDFLCRCMSSLEVPVSRVNFPYFLLRPPALLRSGPHSFIALVQSAALSSRWGIFFDVSVWRLVHGMKQSPD